MCSHLDKGIRGMGGFGGAAITQGNIPLGPDSMSTHGSRHQPGFLFGIPEHEGQVSLSLELHLASKSGHVEGLCAWQLGWPTRAS